MNLSKSSGFKDKRTYSRSRSRNKEDRITERRNRVSKWSDAPSKFTSAPKNPPTTQVSKFVQKTNSLFTSSISNTNTKFNQKSVFQNSPQNLNQRNTFTTGQQTVINTLTDTTKIKKKIYIPKESGINFVGLLIGPKGSYQKRLEQQSGCKILVRGKGTQKEGMPPQPDDHEDQHVLIVGDTEDNVKRATHLVERILYADEVTRTKIKEEQIKASQEIRTELLLKDGSLNPPGGKNSKVKPFIEKYLMTPYGPPDKNARILPVPNDCVGLIIGKNGDTIRRLNRESGCKIQIAVDNVPDSNARNVFIEGPQEKYEVAKKLIEDIISEQIAMKQSFSQVGKTNPFPGPHTLLKIPNKFVGLIIGRSGETVKIIHQSTGCSIFIPNESRPGEDFRELQLSGPKESVEVCKKEILSMIHLALYGRLPYMNSQFYPYVDPVTRLPIIDPGIMAQLDPNTKREGEQSFQNNIPQPIIQINPIQPKNETGINNNTNNNNQANEANNPKESGNENKVNNNTKDLNNPQSTGNAASQSMNEGGQNFLPQQVQQGMQYTSPEQMQGFPNKYESFEQLIFQNSKVNSTELDYDLEDYNNPLNYDLYYQSLYQMYPQMNDYYKKVNQDEVIGRQNPLMLLNNSLLVHNDNKMETLDNNRIYQMQQTRDTLEEEKKSFKKGRGDYKKK